MSRGMLRISLSFPVSDHGCNLPVIMSNYKARSDYFKSIAHDNKLIAHEQPVAPGSEQLRKSFHRVNDLDELNTACRNWAHFPCVVHVGHDVMYKPAGVGMPHRINGNHLFFLAKIDKQNFPALSDAMESAYDVAMTAMDQFLSYMREDLEINGVCGNLFIFDFARANAEQIGPYNDVLYGWRISFYDEKKACELGYKSENWFTGIEEASDADCGCGCGDTNNTSSGSNNSCSEIISFEDEDTIVIEMDDARKARLGQLPLVQVWIKDDTGTKHRLANVLVLLDAPPPNVTQITVELTGISTGFIALKNTVS